MQYKNNCVNKFTETFARIIIIINSIALADFFEATYYDISEHLLAASFKDRKFFGLVSTYFNILKTND